MRLCKCQIAPRLSELGFPCLRSKGRKFCTSRDTVQARIRSVLVGDMAVMAVILKYCEIIQKPVPPDFWRHFGRATSETKIVDKSGKILGLNPGIVRHRPDFMKKPALVGAGLQGITEQASFWRDVIAWRPAAPECHVFAVNDPRIFAIHNVGVPAVWRPEISVTVRRLAGSRPSLTISGCFLRRATRSR